MPELVVATKNKGKLREIKELLKDFNLRITSLADYPNASLYGDGSSNNGTLALKNTDDANWRNYYEWTSQADTLQDIQ